MVPEECGVKTILGFIGVDLIVYLWQRSGIN
jgi:hypothetical protein